MGRQARTTCPFCGVGCGLVASGEGRAIEVAGDGEHPSSAGRFCAKAAALGSTVGLEGRLLRPMIGEAEVTWSDAIGRVGAAFAETIAQHGSDSVAFYVSGQLLTEDYYAANKLMKGFIGSANIDTNSRLCMASAVSAHKAAFGADLVPGCYEDLDLADLAVFAGHNAAWTHPVLFRRMAEAKARGQRQVVIDPRRTETAEGADLHLPIAPQTDVRLWNGLLADLVRRGAVDRAFIADHVCGFAEVEAALAKDDQSPAAVAADCGVPLSRLTRFFDAFAAAPRTVSLFSMGSNQSAQGTAKGLAILNAHLATGRIGKPGACPFSITGQPNAMGGREVGGMATTLAAHMDFDAVARERVARFWNAPALAQGPGPKAIDMFEAVAAGQIKAIWIMATNPAVSLPDASRVRAALAGCPFVVVSDCVAENDTMAFAHVKLPALTWGEKDGTVTNSERRISRQRPVLAPPGEAKADWRIIAEVAAALGHGEAFAWRSPAEVFDEWARLTAFENNDRPLNLGALAGLDEAAYEALAPVQWPVTAAGGTARLFEDGVFPTPDGRARMVPARPGGPARARDGAFPFALNTGRVRDHWHTMTRTGLAPELCRHVPEPFVELHPADAGRLGLVDGELARIETGLGEAVVVARVSERQRPGALFMPMHWTDAFAPSGRANPLTAADRDPTSGQPEFKHTPARVRPYGESWRGFFLARETWAPPQGLDLVWRRIPKGPCQLHEFAGRGGEAERRRAHAALTADAPGKALCFEDGAAGGRREAFLDGERLERVVFISTTRLMPSRDWLVDLFAAERLTAAQRAALAAGRPQGPVAGVGRIVCVCRGVGAARIEAAAASGAATLDAIAAATGAGEACGSCRTEVKRLLDAHLKMLAHAPAA